MRASGNGLHTRHFEECGSHAERVRLSAALLDRGWGETALRGFPGASQPPALDAAGTP